MDVKDATVFTDAADPWGGMENSRISQLCEAHDPKKS